MCTDTTYNYVIFGAGDYYKVGYHDLTRCPNVLYLEHYMQTIHNPLVRLLTRLTFSHKVNRILHYPFRRFTFKRVLTLPFTDNKPLCFLYFGNVYWSTAFLVNSPYFSYLKQTYPDAKFGMYIQDVVARNPHLDIPHIKEQFDFVLSYDKGDCAKYGLTYHPTPYSTFPVVQDNAIPESDVYFCGRGKDRYPLIHAIYEQCTAKGLKCDFHITDMPADAPRVQGIHYRPLSYIENLRHIVRTKCILEIMQSEADGFTPRVWESLFYAKHLLTNNPTFAHSPYYRPSFSHLVPADTETIGEWINRPVAPVSEAMQEELSPKRLIAHIDTLLTKQ